MMITNNFIIFKMIFSIANVFQVNCRGYNAFGRRKRAIDSENNTDTGGDLLAGQLREEITIQSNAIITFEKREERGPDSRIGMSKKFKNIFFP